MALLCIALVAACTNDAVEAVPTEVNLDIVHPSGSGALGFEIDRVDYRVTCAGTAPGTFPIPPTSTGGDPDYDDSVDVSGSFEIVDTRTPPIWQATMGLPPGDCTMTMSVWDGDEIVCVGSETLTIVEGSAFKFDIVLVCSLSVDMPDGSLRVDGSFSFVVGNLCPRLYSLMAIPSTVDINTLPPRTRVEYRTIDPDASCGDNCEPQTCDTSVPPVCTPSVYNPDDPRCDPAFGGSPTSPACLDGTASGLVCTLTATPTATAVPGGNFISPLDGTTPVGPSVAVNLDDFGLDGTGVAVPGVDVLYECDTAIPGSVTMDLICGDGDPVCNRVESMTVICPGVNFCDSDPIDCSGPNDCTADGLCDAFCDPADICDRCPGQGDPLVEGTVCASSGGTVCDGAGACVQCVDSQNSGTPATNPNCDSSPVDCLLPSVCSGNACQPRQTAPDGTACSNGECQGGVCTFVPIDPPAQTRSLTLACTNSVTPQLSFLSFDLTVDPTPVVSSTTLTVDFDGVAELSEAFLDTAQSAVVGGVDKANLLDLQATTHLRAGGGGADVTLLSEPIAFTCEFDGAPCDPVNDSPSIPGARANSDCVPTGAFNPCGRFVDVPTSADCAPGGICDGLGKLGSQCTLNGFCVTGPLQLPLAAATQPYLAAASGNIRFGWDDASTGATLDVDGTWILPAAVFNDPTGPNGIRVNAGGLAVALECTMAVDSNDPVHGVGVVGKSSPTPDSLLVNFPIQVP